MIRPQIIIHSCLTYSTARGKLGHKHKQRKGGTVQQEKKIYQDQQYIGLMQELGQV